MNTNRNPLYIVFSRPGVSGGSSAHDPARNLSSHLQVNEAVHERRSGQETQVWHDRPDPGEDARQMSDATKYLHIFIAQD